MIIGGDGPDPELHDIIRLDDLLADDGIPVFQRPFQAAKLWGKEQGDQMLALMKEGIFRDAYRQLHPSVPFDSDSFLTLCVSARAVSYIIRPPMAYGRGVIKPFDHTTISEQEMVRLWQNHPEDFWELQWQGLDAIDLFMARMNFHPKSHSARNMMETAINQLTASARQLVACEIDSSIPQGMIMACELAGKAVLLHVGGDEKALKHIGHNIVILHSAIAQHLRSPIDATISDVISTLPNYVEVRYDAPRMNIIDAQNIFRKAMFIIADLMRRTNHDQAYWRAVIDPSIPSRRFY